MRIYSQGVVTLSGLGLVR